MATDLERLFPGLQGTAYRVTSPADERYNCVAWAAGVNGGWWWPSADPGKSHWPAAATRDETIQAFHEAFTSLGYAVCDTVELEAGFERIALFTDAAGCPAHVARQLPNGMWSSKLGRREDIEHVLKGLEGETYGTVALLMKRSRG